MQISTLNIHTSLEKTLPNLLIINPEMQILWISEGFRKHFDIANHKELLYLNEVFSKEILLKIYDIMHICDIQMSAISVVTQSFNTKERFVDINMHKVFYQEKPLYRIEWKEYNTNKNLDIETLRVENQILRNSNHELNAINQNLNKKIHLQQKLIEKLSAENNYLLQTHDDPLELDLAVMSAEKQIVKSELLESQKRLQLALDAGQLGIWDWNIETDSVVYNKRWAAMLGYELTDIAPNVEAFFHLLHPEDAILMKNLVDKHLKGDSPYFEIELRLKGKDGQYHWIYDRGMVVARDAKGTPLRAVGIHVYINDHKKANQALKDSEQRFRNIFYFNSIGIVISDMKGNIIDANPKIMESLGYTLEELRLLRPIDFSHAEDLDIERRLSREMMEQGRDFFQMEKRYIRKDKKVIWMNFSLTLVKGGNQQLQMVIALMEDITAKKVAEEQLRSQNQMLHKMNEELNNFVYRTSHDLRAPLTSLMGLVQITEMANSGEERGKYLSMMTKQLHYLDGVIKEIIDYRKISVGEVSISAISLKEKVYDVMQHFQFLPNYTQIEKKVHLEGDVPFYSDETKLNIILNNLISNAIKYSDKCKENPFLHIYISVSTENVSIEIRDNGIGISEEHLPNIFKMFFRATVQENGTGLGLYIVSEALNKLGATIDVTSKEKEGTCFILVIPNIKQ